MKLGNMCHVSTLPRDVFPVDIALGIDLIAKGNDITTEADELQQYTIILDNGALSENEENNLHPDISSRCSGPGSSYRKFTEQSITESERDDLHNGLSIFIDSKPDQGNCVVGVCN